MRMKNLSDDICDCFKSGMLISNPGMCVTQRVNTCRRRCFVPTHVRVAKSIFLGEVPQLPNTQPQRHYRDREVKG